MDATGEALIEVVRLVRENRDLRDKNDSGDVFYRILKRRYKALLSKNRKLRKQLKEKA